MALMAKAGLYLPSAPPEPQPSQHSSAPAAAETSDHHSSHPAPQGSSDSAPLELSQANGSVRGPFLAWFDAVLADIGDSQDLQQSLSTFSGHIRRVDGILRAAGPKTLVLLDEVCPRWQALAKLSTAKSTTQVPLENWHKASMLPGSEIKQLHFDSVRAVSCTVPPP